MKNIRNSTRTSVCDQSYTTIRQCDSLTLDSFRYIDSLFRRFISEVMWLVAPVSMIHWGGSEFLSWRQISMLFCWLTRMLWLWFFQHSIIVCIELMHAIDGGRSKINFILYTYFFKDLQREIWQVNIWIYIYIYYNWWQINLTYDLLKYSYGIIFSIQMIGYFIS